ncbi:MAG: DUF481 domain-containing protein [Opitutus sp.]|nr:DUF481 domain-containing protein [Opitutus sp.]
MNQFKLLRASLALVAGAFCAANLSADVVETKSGARIVGKVTKIDGGAVTVSTDYAGAITIKQSEVTAITTDAPIAVRLATGTRIDGKVSTSGSAVQIAGSDGAISTTVDKVAASWAAGGKDPAVAALERGWAYEAAVDVAGKTGNKEQLGTGFTFRATLAGSGDKLQFYTAYDRQISDGLKSADQFKAGIDYANNFSGAKSWYVRNEGGFDRVKDIELYDVAAAGLGYDVIKAPKQTLTGRAGFSFRYAGYKNPKTVDVKSAGLDFGLAHRFELDNSVLINRISYVPTFEDFSNFVLTHESALELPLLSTKWKVRLGVSNDYNSQSGKGVKKLDTTYFTRLVLNWR